MSRNKRNGWLLMLCATALLAGAAHAAPPDKVALTGGRIIPVVGDEIDSGVILIDRGRIVAVGKDIEIPYDYMEVDVTGKVLMPGMINPHDARGMDVQNEQLPVAPFLDVYDAIDPSRSFFEDSLRDGVTTIHAIQANNTVIGAVSRAVRPIGITIDEMTVAPDIALKMSITPRSGFDPMRQMATFRETWFELDDYLTRLAETKYEESLKKDNKPIDVTPAVAAERGRPMLRDEDYDDAHRNLIRLRRGDLGAWIWCGTPNDVAPAIRMAKEQGFLEKTVLVLGTTAYRAMSELKAAGRPVVLDENLYHRDRDPETGEITEVFVPSKIHEAGLLFALQTNPSGSMAERYLNYQAALCVRNGIPRAEALKAITLNPARMMGLDSRLGSLEVGKTANIVVMSGDPLDFNSWVELVYIDGILAYDRARDPRLKKLLEVEQKARDAAEATQQKTETPPATNPPAGENRPGDAGNREGRSGGGGGRPGSGEGGQRGGGAGGGGGTPPGHGTESRSAEASR